MRLSKANTNRSRPAETPLSEIHGPKAKRHPQRTVAGSSFVTRRSAGVRVLPFIGLLLAAQLSCASHVQQRPPDVAPRATAPTRAAAIGWQYRGMTFISWTRDGYMNPSSLASLDRMVARNVRWIAIVPHWFMDNRSSTRIYPDGTKYTPTDDSVRYIIQQAHSRGLKVMLKPHVDPKDGTWRGSITPSDPAAWFASYRTFILHYAGIAAQTGTELFSMSNELRSMTIGSTYAPNWRALVADVRAVFAGKLTAAANWGPRNWAEYLRVQWWDALDYIGINAYFSLTGAPHPTVEMAVAGWFNYLNPWGTMEHWVDDVQRISAQFGGKRVIFTEIGYNSNPTAGDPWYTDGESVPDMQSQQNCVEAAFRVWADRPYMVGGFWWEWRIDPNAGGTGDSSMILNNKPAAETIAAWFGGATPPADTTAPSVPAGLSARALSSSSIQLSWSASTDDVGVTGYDVYRNGARAGTSSATTYTDTGLTPATTYAYQVAARDAAGNVSALSAPVNGATTSDTTAGGYDFETGTQGWFRSERCLSLQSSATAAFRGQRSLRCQLGSVSGATPGYAAVVPPSSLTAGRTITLWVYVEGTATNLAARAYVQAANKAWTNGARVTLTPSAWTQISVTVPAAAPLPLYRLGVQFQTSSGTFTGYADVDAVQW